jgi:hypothetical protein
VPVGTGGWASHQTAAVRMGPGPAKKSFASIPRYGRGYVLRHDIVTDLEATRKVFSKEFLYAVF